MTKLFSSRLLAIVCITLAIGIATSCKKDNNEKSGIVTLFSFGPTGSKHGDTLRFIGANLDKVSSIQFTGTAAVVEQKDFKLQTTDRILVIVPDAAEKGFVTLKTPAGDIVTKTQLDLDVNTTIASITAQARPGEDITITGNYLNWVNKITFAKNKIVETFVSKTINQLVVTVPADAETGPLVLSFGGTEPADVETADTLKVTLPVITALSPNPVKHKTNLTITGTNLDLAKEVVFTGVSTPVTTFISQSATQLVVQVPEGTQKGKVILVAASGVESTSANDLDVLLPSITLFAPNPVDPGANLTITGTNLDLVTSISFVGALSAVTTFVSQSPTQIVVAVPMGVLKGKITLAVLNSILTVQSTDDLKVTGGLPPLADFVFPIFTDGLQNTFQDWSYTDTHNFNSTANVRQGTTSIMAVYSASNGYQGLTFHAGTGAATGAYTSLEFSIFGEAGTGGKNLNVVVNGNYSTPPHVTIVEGEWTTFNITLLSLGSPDPINEIVLQSAGWGGTIHVDHVGLR